MQANEADILRRILVSEGGYVNDPDDPGGATNRGITQHTYDAWRRSQSLPTAPVRGISDSEVASIYDAQYWDKVMGDKLPSGLDYVMMDGAVNSGPSQATKWLQRALGSYYAGGIDGIMGLKTLLAIDQYPDKLKLINSVLDRRLAYLEALRTWKKFGRGWLARVASVRSISLRMAAADSTAATVDPVPDTGAAKAPLEDARPLPAKAPASAAAGAGVGAGGVAGTLQQLQDQLSPLTGSSTVITHIVAGLAIGGALLAIGGIGWSYWAARRSAKLADALDISVS